MTTPVPSSKSSSQDVIFRSFVLQADALMQERMKKQSEVRGFTIHCDGGRRVITHRLPRLWPTSPRRFCFER